MYTIYFHWRIVSLLVLLSLLCYSWNHPGNFILGLASTPSSSSSSSFTRLNKYELESKHQVQIKQVAVIGSTGRLGYETVQQLSQLGIPSRCLVRRRHTTTTTTPPPQQQHDMISKIQSLPNVEIVYGDVNDIESLRELMNNSTMACLALHGPTIPKPWYKSIVFPNVFFNEDTDMLHPKQINYIGIQNIIQCMKQSLQCHHLIRITGKGETPFSFFSILINTLGGIAKGWNYEGEQYIRDQYPHIQYTIIRPGIMKDQSLMKHTSSVPPILGLRDNGNDMKVSVVSYQQIASLVIQSLYYPNCYHSTITAMNIDPTTTAATATTTTTTEAAAATNISSSDISIPYQTIDMIQPDTRQFPNSLIRQHKLGARIMGLSMISFGTILCYTICIWMIQILLKLLQ